jgi:hypothetical protein
MFRAVAKTFPRKEAAPDGSTNAASADDEQDEEAADEAKD